MATTLATITIKSGAKTHRKSRIMFVSDWLIQKAEELESSTRLQYAEKFTARYMDPFELPKDVPLAILVFKGAAAWGRPVVRDVAKFLREHASFLRKQEDAFRKAAYRIDDGTAEYIATSHDTRLRKALRLA